MPLRACARNKAALCSERCKGFCPLAALPFSNFDMVGAAAIVAFCVPAALCLRPSSYLARHVSRGAMTVQAGNALQSSGQMLATDRSAEVLATSVDTPRSLVSMLETPVLDQLGSQLSMDTGMDTARSPLLERLEAMEVGACGTLTRPRALHAAPPLCS